MSLSPKEQISGEDVQFSEQSPSKDTDASTNISCQGNHGETSERNGTSEVSPPEMLPPNAAIVTAATSKDLSDSEVQPKTAETQITALQNNVAEKTGREANKVKAPSREFRKMKTLEMIVAQITDEGGNTNDLFESDDDDMHRKQLRTSLNHTMEIDWRLECLERTVRQMQNLKDDTNSKTTKSNPTHILGISHLEWSEFEIKPQVKALGKKLNHHYMTDTKPCSILEVLIEHPNIGPRRRQHREPRQGRDLSEKYEEDLMCSKPPNSVDQIVKSSRIPARVRIRSPILLKILSKFSPKYGVFMHDKPLLTMLHPFKLLVTKAEKIKAHLRELEDRHGEKTTPSNDFATDTAMAGNPSSVVVSENPDDHPKTVSSEAKNQDGPEEMGAGPFKEIESREALEHLRVLVQFIDQDLKPIWELREKISNRTLKKIAFSDLWYLFEYGQEVRTQDNSDIQLYRVVAFTRGRDPINWSEGPAKGTAADKLDEHSQGAFLLQCYCLDFNGTHYGPKDTFFSIRRYEGEKDINTLTCFPLDLDPRGKEVRDMVYHRGVKFAEFSGRDNARHRHKKYTGLTVDKETEQIDSEVIVDFEWAFYRKPEWKPDLGFKNSFKHDLRETSLLEADLGSCGKEGCCGNDNIYRDYEIDNAACEDFQRGYKDNWDRVDNVDDLLNNEKVLLPYRAFGFVLRSRKWAAFAIDLLTEVTYLADGWSHLELPSGHKETVLALVENHAGGKMASQPTDMFGTMDLVKGKGKGLILLLHGEPGVGKTSTAECVAERTKRPLFPITCGDIGDNAYKVEEHLENNFQLAHRWGCVLLLDEADVFLQKRDVADLARNSIVSVFLRTLEYYSGILFLTTNRVGKIDPAFKSRIHLSLFYPRLDRETTVKIWKNHINRIKDQVKKEKKEIDIEYKDILIFSRSHFDSLKKIQKAPWNGRQIRNAFQTAMALAEYEASSFGPPHPRPKLSRAQFEKVAKTSMDFDNYLRSVWGGRDEAEMVAKDQARADEMKAKELTVQSMPTSSGPPREKPQTRAKPSKKPVGVGQTYQQQFQQEESASEHPSDDDLDDDDDDDDDENDELVED